MRRRPAEDPNSRLIDVLARLAGAGGTVVWHPDRRLAREAKLAPRALYRGLAALEGCGLVRRLTPRDYLDWYYRAGLEPLAFRRRPRARIRRVIVLCWRVVHLAEPGRGLPPRRGETPQAGGYRRLLATLGGNSPQTDRPAVVSPGGPPR
jgi:hypothetical protein